jgi:hypothetical protein
MKKLSRDKGAYKKQEIQNDYGSACGKISDKRQKNPKNNRKNAGCRSNQDGDPETPRYLKGCYRRQNKE